jgi:integrase
MTIEPRVSTQGTRYRARVRRRGAPPCSRTFATREEARAWAQATEQTALATRWRPEPDKHTVGELLERYRLEVLPSKSRGTQRWQAAHLAWWHTRVGPLRLSELLPAVLVTCRQELGATRSPGTVRGYLTTLTHALALAVQEWQWLDVSPMTRVSKPAAPRGRVRYLSDDERRRLLTACTASSNPALHLIVLLALATGCRRMELLGLRWADVDLARQVLTLQATKNGERRRVPLTGQAFDLLTTWAKVRRLESSLVFPRADGRAPVDIRSAFAQALRQAAIADFRFHDLRHSCASYLAMHGASLLDIAAILGHKTLAMVQRYSHLSDGHLRSTLAKMTAAL